MKKLYYSKIKRSFASAGYILLSEKYINAHQYLDFVCPNGHKHKITWNNWKHGYRCLYCSHRKPEIYQNVYNSFFHDGYTLLETEFFGSKKLLKFICPNGHYHSISWDNWKKGNRCGICYSQRGQSKSEKDLLEFIKTFYSGAIYENDRTQIANPLTGWNLELDIFLPNEMKAIEYNGEFWHNNEYQKRKDEIKASQCENKKIQLLVIYEKMWLNDTDITKQTIKNFILDDNKMS